MDRKINCTEVVKMILNEASERFAPLWIKNERLFEQAMQTCGILDEFCKTCAIESFEIEVNEITMEIQLAITAEHIVIPRQSIFPLTNASYMEIQPSNESQTVFLLVWIDRIWERR